MTARRSNGVRGTRPSRRRLLAVVVAVLIAGIGVRVLLHRPDLYRRGLVLRPHSDDGLLFAVDLTASVITRAVISGCQIPYRTGDDVYQQTFDCEYRLMP